MCVYVCVQLVPIQCDAAYWKLFALLTFLALYAYCLEDTYKHTYKHMPTCITVLIEQPAYVLNVNRVVISNRLRFWRIVMCEVANEVTRHPTYFYAFWGHMATNEVS